jgi:hypothetical protein
MAKIEFTVKLEAVESGGAYLWLEAAKWITFMNIMIGNSKG